MWPPGGQNEKPIQFLDFLTQKTYILNFDTFEANMKNFRFWPLKGQGSQNVNSNKTKWKTDMIFG